MCCIVKKKPTQYMLLFPVHSLLNADKFSNIKFGSELKKWMERVEARWVVAVLGLFFVSFCLLLIQLCANSIRPAYQRGMARLREEEAKAKAESS
jgi:hypothetical protein